MQDFTNDSSTQQSTVSLAFLRLSQKLQKFLDDITPFRTARWIGALVFILLFMIRIVMLQGWYIITYALGIYHLNLFIAFLTPKIDPAMDEFEDDSGPSLPTRANEEFRPFIRRLPEFKFWYSVIKSTLLSIVLTFFQFVDVPVFWPFLVFYFIVLFGIIMKRQIRIRFRVQTNEEKNWPVPKRSIPKLISPIRKLQTNQSHQNTLDSLSMSPRTEFPELSHQQADPSILSSTTSDMIQLFEKLKSPYPNGMTFINHLLNLETCRNLYSVHNKTVTRRPSCAHGRGLVPWQRLTRRCSGDGIWPYV